MRNHPDAAPRNRRARRAWAGLLAATAIAALVVSIVNGTWARDARAVVACRDVGRSLSVSVAPEIAPVVAAAAAQIDAVPSGAAPSNPTGCIHAVVTAHDPADVAAAIRRSPGGRPQVWIPDSSVWIHLAGGVAPPLPSSGPSIALSPTVLAVSRTTALGLGYPNRRAKAGALLGSPEHRSARLRIADPGSSAPALGMTIGLRRAAAASPEARVALAAAVRTAAVDDRPVLGVAGIRRALSAQAPEAVATSEQAVWAYNATDPLVPAVPAYLPHAAYRVGGTELDYPFLVLGDQPEVIRDAARLLARLQSTAVRDQLQALGFRGPGGPGGAPALVAEVPAPRLPVQAPVNPSAVRTAVRLVRAVTDPARILAVIDVSGSMGDVVPSTPGSTKIQLALQAAGNAMSLYPDDTDVGLWEFATDLTAGTDYRPLVPIGHLGVRADGVTGRQRLAAALGRIHAYPNGSTGLYDTVLAAVASVRATWAPRHANSVVLLTDGRNADADGITLDALVKVLKKNNDPLHPVPVISIAYGADSDVPALQAISRATEGAVYLARDPRDISRVFHDAIAQRACRPHC